MPLQDSAATLQKSRLAWATRSRSAAVLVEPAAVGGREMAKAVPPEGARQTPSVDESTVVVVLAPSVEEPTTVEEPAPSVAAAMVVQAAPSMTLAAAAVTSAAPALVTGSRMVSNAGEALPSRAQTDTFLGTDRCLSCSSSRTARSCSALGP